MLDIKFIRENPEKVKGGVQKKNEDPKTIDRILKLDEKRREYIKNKESLKAQQNKLGKGNIEEAKRIKAEIAKIAPNLGKIEKEFNELMLKVPNLPLDNVPVGKDDSCNVVVREVAASGEPRPPGQGERPKFNFKPKDYLEIGEKLDLIDVKRAAKISGTRFGFIKKEAALLEFALINLALDLLTKEGFILLVPPVMIKVERARGMGYLEQTDKEDAYYLPKDDLYLVGTSEQSIGPMHTDEILQEKDLSKRYVAFSTCFRREAGAYGKDTKGIFRVHQFDKVEMFVFCKPEDSEKEHQLLLKMQEKLMRALKIPYRVVKMCTADLAFPQAAKYDIEAWLPGENRYRETHSASNCTNFQARRLNIRYRNPKTKNLEFVHTLNGTAFAVGRTIIAIIENYQQKDGTIKVPKALEKYLGKSVIK